MYLHSVWGKEAGWDKISANWKMAAMTATLAVWLQSVKN
jgi:hypothetical protein